MSEATGGTPSNAAHFSKSKGAPNYPNGVPLDALEEFANNGRNDFALRLQRRNMKGHLISIPGFFRKNFDSMCTFEADVAEQFGGGNFRVEVRDGSSAREVFCTFDMAIEGAPKVANVANGSFPVGDPRGAVTYQGLPGQTPHIPAASWLASAEPAVRAAYMAAQAQHAQAPASVYASDQVLAEALQKRDEELAQLRAKAAAEGEAQAKRLKEAEAELAKQQRELEAARHRGELAAITARLDAMKEVGTQRAPEQKTDWMAIIAGLAPVIAATAPIATAIIGSRTSQSTELAKMQQAQMNMMMTMATQKQPDSTKELLTTFGPMLLPLLSKVIEGKSPESQTALFSALADSQMQAVSMAAQLVEQFSPPPESPAGAVVKQIISGVGEIAASYMASRGGLPGQLPEGPRPVGTLNQTGGQGPSIYHRDVEEEQPVDAGPAPNVPGVARAPRAQQAEVVPEPPAASVLMLFDLLPADLRTPEWKHILVLMHQTPAASPQVVAELITGHIENLARLDMIPSVLSTLHESPRDTLEAVIEKLPVAMSNPGYGRTVLDLVLTMLQEDGYFTTEELALTT